MLSASSTTVRRTRGLAACVAAAVALFGFADAHAAVISTLSPTTTTGDPTVGGASVWPYGAPIDSLVDGATKRDPVAPKLINLGRNTDNILRLGETFQADESITVGTISLLVSSVAASRDVDIRVYRVADTTATTYPASPTPADVLFDYTFSNATTASGSQILELALSGDDIFTVGPRTGNEGYILELAVDGVASTAAIRWEATIANTLAEGRSLRSFLDGTSNEYAGTRDFIFAFQAVPEPASLALVGIGGLAMLSRRRV